MKRPHERHTDPAAVELGSHEHYADPALYDYEYRRRRDDVRWYRDLAKRTLGTSDGPILELGAGSGRLTMPLARDGYRVVAVDHSAPMLAALELRRARLPRAARDRVVTHQGDLRDFNLRKRFPLIIAAFNVLEHLYTRIELDACLRAVRRHLAPGGLFAFDVQLPDPAWLARDPNKRWARTRFTHPTTKKRLWYSTSHDYDPVSQIVIIRLYYTPEDGGEEDVVLISQRKYYPAELEALLAFSGMHLVEHRGDFHGWPLRPGAESQVVVCRSSTERERKLRHPRR